jgi:hypothetical protein
MAIHFGQTRDRPLVVAATAGAVLVEGLRKGNDPLNVAVFPHDPPCG